MSAEKLREVDELLGKALEIVNDETALTGEESDEKLIEGIFEKVETIEDGLDEIYPE